MSRDSRKGTHLELPVEVIEEMKAADEDMWRIVTEVVKTYLAVETDSLVALQRQAEMLDEEINEIEEEIRSLEKTRDVRVGEKERIEARIERIKTNRRSYEEILDDIIDSLLSDSSLRITSQRSELEAAAELHNDGIITEDMINRVCSDVRSRVAERDVDLDRQRLHRDQMAAQSDHELVENESNLRFSQRCDNGNE